LFPFLCLQVPPMLTGAGVARSVRPEWAGAPFSLESMEAPGEKAGSTVCHDASAQALEMRARTGALSATARGTGTSSAHEELRAMGKSLAWNAWRPAPLRG
jgi:hypothetical protein